MIPRMLRLLPTVEARAEALVRSLAGLAI